MQHSLPGKGSDFLMKMWKRHATAGNLKADLESSKSPKVLAFSRAGGVSVRVQEVGGGDEGEQMSELHRGARGR
ncbi:hypothetical protein PDJAM_G00171220 [Pangasius djambal]|uniref:Uncharacterized protein n=1 Tax=Pangasius djambal TaxID=1691987 RepID=A0ACC5ZLF8_9TELE|nr:hypothetical protein [Pangasius djambal]